MTNLIDSPFLLKETQKMVEASKVYIRALDSINNYKSMATDTPYQANFNAIISSEDGLYPQKITILFGDMLEAMQLLNQQHKYIAARVVESAYHIIKSQIEFESKLYQ